MPPRGAFRRSRTSPLTGDVAAHPMFMQHRRLSGAGSYDGGVRNAAASHPGRGMKRSP